MRGPTFLLLLVALPGAARADGGADAWTRQEAQAHALGGVELLYREEHLLRLREGRPLERLVLYRCPDGGAAFARKRVDYSASAHAPAFALEDARSGYREGMRRAPAGTRLYVRPASGATEREVSLASAPGVADAGFDEFIRTHWQALAGGEALPLSFAVPARLRTMDFRVRRAGSTRVAGEEALVFRLRVDGLLGFVAPHIDVAYGAQSRRLLRFEGMGNLREPDGGGQWQVRIDFPRPAVAAAATAWNAALAEPLVRRCESGQQADSAADRTREGLSQVTDS
jgi:hypothetical protein